MMNSDRRSLIQRLVIVGALLVICLVTATVYATRRNPYAPLRATASAWPPLSNPEVLLNWLPATSYDYTIARIDDYLRVHNTPAVVMTAADHVTPGSGSYDFTITTQEQRQVLSLSVTITSHGGTSLSTSVAINGAIEPPLVPGGSQSTTDAGGVNYSGFDALVSDGASALQANELLRAFYTFSPTADSVIINTYSIRETQGTIDGNAVFTYTFSVGVNNKQYDAVLNDYGFLQAQLILKDQKTGKQVFDSGMLSQGS